VSDWLKLEEKSAKKNFTFGKGVICLMEGELS
jgi:hypothetical protein